MTMPRVKVCGITRTEDALLAAELGASAIGLIFWPGSPRCVEFRVAREIVAALPAHVVSVGVFVDQPRDDVQDISRQVQLGAVQLHGHEPLDYAAALMEPVIKAIAVNDRFDVALLQAIPETITVLLDAHDPVKRGGTGRTIDWTRAAEAAATRPVILSGGLNADNVDDAIRTVHPYGIDLSSGVEASPGVKDHAKLRALFAALENRPSERAARTRI
ncbi:MAG: phosphoribosylanthranilate isomerase [Vicinamibacterales bacterium]